MAAALEVPVRHPQSPVFTPLEHIEVVLSGLTRVTPGPTPTLASPFETPEGSDMTDTDTRSEGSVEGANDNASSPNCVDEEIQSQNSIADARVDDLMVSLQLSIR